MKNNQRCEGMLLKLTVLTFALVVTIEFPASNAKIVEDGIWTGKESDNPFVYRLDNGIPKFIMGSDIQRVESAQMTPIEDIGNIFEFENVKLVNRILSEEDFNSLFPDRNTQYDQGLFTVKLEYVHFLKAVAQYPAFCGEYVQDAAMNLGSLEEACKRELATLFAHITHETGDQTDSEPEYTAMRSLYQTTEECGSCYYHYTQNELGKKFPPRQVEKYRGRGPIHLRWNHMYGMFSRSFFDSDYWGWLHLLIEPSNILDDPVLQFASALWLYMTPQYPQVSAHNIMTGFFVPNNYDLSLRAGNDFGTSIIVMSQDQPQSGQPVQECDTSGWVSNENAENRARLFDFYCNEFGLQQETAQANGCESKHMTYDGSGTVPSFWYQDAYSLKRCKLVWHETAWSVYVKDDYKRCVCYFYGDADSDGENSCLQEAKPQHCNWDVNALPFYHRVQIPVLDQINIDVYTLIQNLQTEPVFPACLISEEYLGGLRQLNIIDLPQFMTLELVEDNQKRRQLSPEFRDSYTNENDSILGADAPSGMYTASTLGQKSLLVSSEPISDQDRSFIEVSEDSHQFFLADFDPALHEGSWLFSLKVCIDRRQEDFQAFDCDNGQNFIYLDIIDCANFEQYFDDKPAECISDSDSSDDAKDEEEKQSEEEDQNQSDVEEEEKEKDAVNNEAPYFVDEEIFDPKLWQIQVGEELQLWLPEYEDYDSDEVTISVILTEEQKQWIEVDSIFQLLTIRPNLETSLDYTGIEVILDDQTTQVSYLLRFWITEQSNQDEIDPEEIDPEPKDPLNPSKPDDPPIDEPEDPDEGKDDEDNDEEETSDPSENNKSNENKNSFDPSTLYAVDRMKNQIQKRKYKVLVEIEPEEIEELPEPKTMIESVNQNGQVFLIFDQEMLFDETFGGFEFQTEAKYDESNDDEFLLRSLQESNQVDLLSILDIQVLRGSEYDSAPQSQLSFKAQITSYDEQSINLKITYDNPLSVSIGERPDILFIKFVESELFVSSETGKSLAPDTEIKMAIPKQFPSDSAYEIAVITGSTVQAAANLSFMSQFGVTICLAVSLKAMWNLMHVMQVLAFLRLLVDMPANCNILLLSMHNAITLENLLNSIYDSAMPFFTDPEEEQHKEDLKNVDISYDNVYLSLGIFGLVFAFLVFGIGLYYLLRCLSLRVKCCAVIMSILKAKLFYNAWIRYMIESNLKVTANCLLYLIIDQTYDDFGTRFQSGLRILIFALIVIWPIFIIGFLHWKRSELQNTNFKAKFISMYSGIKIDKLATLIYTAIFCFRRFMLVIALVIFGKNSVFVIVAYHVIQTVYFWYMTNIVPHEESIHNYLEYFDEICVIGIQYLMIFFLTGGDVDPEFQWEMGSYIIAIVIIVFTVNVLALIYISVMRVIFWCRVRKARQAYMKAKIRRGAFKHSSSNLIIDQIGADFEALNLAQSRIEGIKNEAIETEGSIRIPANYPARSAIYDSQQDSKLIIQQERPRTLQQNNQENQVDNVQQEQKPSTMQALMKKASILIENLFIEPEQDSAQDVHIQPVPSVDNSLCQDNDQGCIQLVDIDASTANDKLKTTRKNSINTKALQTNRELMRKKFPSHPDVSSESLVESNQLKNQIEHQPGVEAAQKKNIRKAPTLPLIERNDQICFNYQSNSSTAWQNPEPPAGPRIIGSNLVTQHNVDELDDEVELNIEEGESEEFPVDDDQDVDDNVEFNRDGIPNELVQSNAPRKLSSLELQASHKHINQGQSNLPTLVSFRPARAQGQRITLSDLHLKYVTSIRSEREVDVSMTQQSIKESERGGQANGTMDDQRPR